MSLTTVGLIPTRDWILFIWGSYPDVGGSTLVPVYVWNNVQRNTWGFPLLLKLEICNITTVLVQCKTQQWKKWFWTSKLQLTLKVYHKTFTLWVLSYILNTVSSMLQYKSQYFLKEQFYLKLYEHISYNIRRNIMYIDTLTIPSL